jgi:hypothetical protein
MIREQYAEEGIPEEGCVEAEILGEGYAEEDYAWMDCAEEEIVEQAEEVSHFLMEWDLWATEGVVDHIAQFHSEGFVYRIKMRYERRQAKKFGWRRR